MAAPIRNDTELLNDLECRIERIRDRVKSVALGYHTACYLVGRPGTSKTFTVEEELKSLEEPFAYRNARMTPVGLFDFIAEHPQHVLVLDDIGTLFKNEQAMQILMAATDGDPKEPRRVTYKSKDKQPDVDFSGGIIAISNVALRHDPLARAHDRQSRQPCCVCRQLAQGDEGRHSLHLQGGCDSLQSCGLLA